jgi:uncharacterized membrane protein SpoIIM required for sporulation
MFNTGMSGYEIAAIIIATAVGFRIVFDKLTQFVRVKREP